MKEQRKHYSKHLVAVLLATVLLSTLFIGVALGFLANQSTYGPKYADYIVMEGVAGNDYYDSRQYSYQINQWANETVCGVYGSRTGNPNPANNWFNASKSLRVGFTEFGEFATLNNTGVAYGANTVQFGLTESWASTHIPSKYWIQGWLFYMNYTRGGSGGLRQIEAYSVYSDTVNTEAGRGVYSWAGDDITYATGYTVGNLTASGVQVLYDSARLVVARATVLIQDGAYGFEDVAKITFTVIYNKDTKYAIVYKDIKILLDTKILVSINDFVFQEKYEIDLARGVNQGNTAYIHWYHNYNSSTYMHPLTGSNMTDVVQAFDPAQQYIFFAGYWPNCTEYSVSYDLVPVIPVQGFTAILPRNTAEADNVVYEPNTPWVTAQWRYQSISANLPNYFPKMLNFLAKATSSTEGVPVREIRFVEVFGMTDFNRGNTAYNLPDNQYHAQDIQAGDGYNSLDIEVRYMLYGKVFVPEDLRSINNQPFQWIGMGQSAATTDSAGAAALADLNQAILQEPLGLFDRNDTAFPWTAPTITNKGTIPYGLVNYGNFGTTTYTESFNNVAKLNGGVSTGTDPTTYIRTGLRGFAFNYDGTGSTTPQPVAGGYASSSYWYPSKDPLTERWNSALTSMIGYSNIYYGPNGIISLGGEKANGLTRYFNDFNFAITREGVAPGYALADNDVVTGSAPTSNPSINTLDYFPLSTWASSITPTYKNTNDAMGYAVIALARDVNGTRGLSVYGWDARDTYWGAAWASQYLGAYVNNNWIPAGTVALIVSISYTGPNAEPSLFTVVKALGTITEFGTNLFVTNYGGFDAITNGAIWNGLVNPPSLPNVNSAYKVWWYAKLPTVSTAKVDFDP